MAPYVVLFALPEGWERFDVWEADAGAAIARRLDERLSGQGVEAEAREALTRTAALAVEYAAQAGTLVWAIRAPGDGALPMTLTIGVNAVPGREPDRSVGGGPSQYLSPPTALRPLDLIFDDVVGFTREWRLATTQAGQGMFCAQGLVVTATRQVTATVNVSAFEPADEDEVRAVAATVARTLRLAAVPEAVG